VAQPQGRRVVPAGVDGTLHVVALVDVGATSATGYGVMVALVVNDAPDHDAPARPSETVEPVDLEAHPFEPCVTQLRPWVRPDHDPMAHDGVVHREDLGVRPDEDP
jgi:hypothetical protein